MQRCGAIYDPRAPLKPEALRVFIREGNTALCQPGQEPAVRSPASAEQKLSAVVGLVLMTENQERSFFLEVRIRTKRTPKDSRMVFAGINLLGNWLAYVYM